MWEPKNKYQKSQGSSISSSSSASGTASSSKTSSDSSQTRYQSSTGFPGSASLRHQQKSDFFGFEPTLSHGPDVSLKQNASPLPPGWKCATDPDTNRVYFYNKTLGISQFEVPRDHVNSPPLPPPPPAPVHIIPPRQPTYHADTSSTALTVTPIVESGRRCSKHTLASNDTVS